MLLDKDLTPIHNARRHYHCYDEILDSLDMLLDTGLIKNPYDIPTNPTWATQGWVGWVWGLVRENGKGPIF